MEKRRQHRPARRFFSRIIKPDIILKIEVTYGRV